MQEELQILKKQQVNLAYKSMTSSESAKAIVDTLARKQIALRAQETAAHSQSQSSSNILDGGSQILSRATSPNLFTSTDREKEHTTVTNGSNKQMASTPKLSGKAAVPQKLF